MGENESTKERTQQSSSSNTIDNGYVVQISNRLTIILVLGLAILAFLLGRFSRAMFGWDASSFVYGPRQKVLMELAKERLQLPALLRGGDENTLATLYTCKHFDVGADIRSDSVLIEQPEITAMDNCMIESYGSQESATIAAISRPSGQHLLVDIANVDASFLNSTELLTRAMVKLAKESSLALLSYHCHRLKPAGVSCAGILLKSHVTFHTWPLQEAITLDLFTSKTESIIPLLSSIEKLFGVPKTLFFEKEAQEKKVTVKWLYKKRGFRVGKDRFNEEEVDLFEYLLGNQRFEKSPVALLHTDFQRIDFYDVIDIRSQSVGSHRRSLVSDGSYESKHPELFQLDRILYLDHIMQSRRYGEGAYHESLVHPAMFAHENPKRVAIIGGGEGATLREVLKHKTVENAVMIEIDEMMVNASKAYIPEWSDCSNIAGSDVSCFDDSRAQVFYEDAIAWFIDRYLDKDDLDEEEGFDIIIMDAL